MAMNDTQTVKVATPQNPHAASKQIAATDVERERIAVAAYHKAAARGFAAGHEVADWLAAERELAMESQTEVPHIGNSLSTDEFEEGPKSVAGVRDLRSAPIRAKGTEPRR
jgi:hypothetical protein